MKIIIAYPFPDYKPLSEKWISYLKMEYLFCAFFSFQWIVNMTHLCYN